MAKNESMTKAKETVQDEFYTRLTDIEAELKNYKSQFKGATVLCNCDDPFESNFFKYFAMNFKHLELKKLIATCYAGSPITGTQLSLDDVIGVREHVDKLRIPYKIEILEVTDENHDGAVDLNDVETLIKKKKNTLSLLEGDGDFRSEECRRLMEAANIIVTNPPFSLFREYLAQLVEMDKKFLIIGNQNAVTYKEVFPLIKNNRVWLGYRSGDMEFQVPDYYPPKEVRFRVDENGIKWRSMGNVCWYTNLDVSIRHDALTLYKGYTPEEYPSYDNYDAIEVGKTSEIPYDYDGAMGVPITFLDKYNPEQFEILGITAGRDEFEATPTKRYINPKQINKNGTATNGSKANTRATLLLDKRPNDIYYTADNAEGPLKILYARIIIKRKGNTL